MTTEEWRPVVGFPAYEVSDLGRVRNVLRARGRRVGHVLSQTKMSNGFYLKVDLYARGRRFGRPVHRLVGEAFYGPLPKGLQTRHLNGDGFDNRLENLRYGTAAENMQDQIDHGHHYWLNQTHCKAGHEYSAVNTARTPIGRRRCKKCDVRKSIAYQKRRLARVEAAGVVTSHVIREWARGNGFEVAAEGRLPNAVKNAFLNAQLARAA